MTKKLGRIVTQLDKLITIESRGLARLRDKLKTYLHYLNTYRRQSWQDDDLSSGTPTHIVT